MPKVSVSLITYNHQDYIAECLESVISQKTNFDFEIVISDDCSTDNTSTIVAWYAARYPDIIKPLIRTQNIGMVANAIDTISRCDGEYIALMEGDDLWVDPGKLQRQSDVLDGLPDCVFCFTNQIGFSDRDIDNGKIFYHKDNTPLSIFDINYLIEKNVHIPCNSKMFRKSVHPSKLPGWYYDILHWDWVLNILHARNGRVAYVDCVTLGYRSHPLSLMTDRDNRVRLAKSGIRTLKELNRHLNYRFNHKFSRFAWHYNYLAFAYLGERNVLSFIRYYLVFLLSLRSRDEFHLRNDLWKVRQFFRERPKEV